MSAPLLACVAALAVGGDFENLVAPATEGVVWLDHGAPANVNRAVSSSGLQHLAETFGAPRESGLEAWRGKAVVLVALPERSESDVVPFLELLARANHDRELVVATLLPAPLGDDKSGDAPPFDRDELERRMRASRGLGPDEELELPRPSERLAAGYVDGASPWMPTQHLVATVVGPSGERLGAARLPEDEDRLFELVEAALLRYGAPPLERDLPDALLDAQALYFEGDWDRARKAAERVAKKAAKKDPEAAEGAAVLTSRLEELERSLYTDLVEAGDALVHGVRLATIGTAARRGFPKGRAAQYVDEIFARERSTIGGATPLEAAFAFVEALPGRPALFAEVADARARKHAKALGKILTRTSSYSGPVTQRMQALLARHESAPKKR